MRRVVIIEWVNSGWLPKCCRTEMYGDSQHIKIKVNGRTYEIVKCFDVYGYEICSNISPWPVRCEDEEVINVVWNRPCTDWTRELEELGYDVKII